MKKHQWNSHKFPKKYEVNNQPSLTVPDQAMSIKEIMYRTAHGLPTSGQRVPMYAEDEDDDMPDLTHMDLAEKQEYVDSMKTELKELNDKREKSEQDKKEKRQKAQWEKQQRLDSPNNDDKSTKPDSSGGTL